MLDKILESLQHSHAILFHFQNGFPNELSFSKCDSFLKFASIFKMWKVLWVLFFLFPKNTIVNKNLYIHYKWLYWWEIYIMLLNLFQLSRIYNFPSPYCCHSLGFKWFPFNSIQLLSVNGSPYSSSSSLSS